MIKSFKVSQGSASEFIKNVTESLATRELGKIANISMINEKIVIRFSKLGKSEVFFSLTKQPNGFECIHESEKISLTHRAFRTDIETKLAKVLEQNGAIITT